MSDVLAGLVMNFTSINSANELKRYCAKKMTS